MTGQPPPIDPRDRQQITEQTTALAQHYSGWQPPRDRPDAGQALIGVFARFAELVVQRINRAPERNYLAFLNLIGTRPLPSLPARVPLTFSLAEGSPADAVVPAGTQVAATPLEGEDDEIVFETESPLVVSRAQVRALFVGDARHDTYLDCTARTASPDPEPFLVFHSDQPTPHQLFLACDPVLAGPGSKDVTLVVRTSDAEQLANWPISWVCWDGAAWQPVAATAVARDGTWRVTLTGLPELSPHEVNGIRACWVRAQLDVPLPPGGSELGIEAVAVGGRPPQHQLDGLFPFGDTQVKWCYLGFDETAAVGGAVLRLHVRLARAAQGQGPATPVRLVWSCKVGNEWRELGRSSSRAEREGSGDPRFRDGTQALTRDGDISFRVPWQWPGEAFRNRLSRWLRVEIADDGGSYATLPQLASLTASYVWDLPVISQVEVEPNTPPQPEPSPAAFANNTPLDISRDFYPFGEQPRFNDTCYLACPDGLARPGAVVELTVRLTNVTSDGPVPTVRTEGRPGVVWEAWDGTGWRMVRVSDANYAFTRDSTLQITLPAGYAPTAVSGQQGHWLRVRLVRGDYGTAAGYRKNADGSYEPVPATFAPPVIQALSWRPARGQVALVPASACVSYNDFRYSTHRPGAGDSFPPFAPGAEHDPALYLGFDQPFDPRPVTLYLQVEPPEPEEVAADRLAEIDPATRAQLVWEYSGPDGWQSLAAVDETEALAGRGLVRFVGPADPRTRDCFDQRRYWLRVRWQRGRFPILPRLRRVLPNTTWATQAVGVRDEILGSGSGDPGQRFTTAQAPLLPGQQLLVREPDHPAPDEAAALRAEEGPDAITVTADDTGHPEEIWVRWHAVPDFYRSGPLDRHYVADPISGEIRFGDGKAGRLPPRGQHNIRISYRTGGGAAGNRPAGSIVTLRSAIPFIDSVTNHERSQGGSAQEPVERLRARGPRALRHGDRAVTVEDFEDLALDASAEVARVRAVAPGQFDPYGLWLDPAAPRPGTGHTEADAGRVGLIVVPDSADPRPAPSLGLLRQVQSHLRARCPATAQLWVAGPEWIRVTVTATVVPRSLDLADVVRGRVGAALERYLHPLTGGPDGDGWEFGRKPHRSDLFALVEAVDGVDHVRSLGVEQVPESDSLGARLTAVLGRSLADAAAHQPAADLDSWLRRALVYSGGHRITVTF